MTIKKKKAEAEDMLLEMQLESHIAERVIKSKVAKIFKREELPYVTEEMAGETASAPSETITKRLKAPKMPRIPKRFKPPSLENP